MKTKLIIAISFSPKVADIIKLTNHLTNQKTYNYGATGLIIHMKKYIYIVVIFTFLAFNLYGIKTIVNGRAKNKEF